MTLSSLALLASSAALSGPAFAAPAPDWNRLHFDHAEASSFLRSNWNKYNENYHPNYVGDDNPATAWVEGVDGQGEGETLLLPVSALSSARAVQLRIRNGYQKSEGLLAANSAPQEVRLTALAGGRAVASTTARLERSMGWQTLSLALPAGSPLSAVSLQVLSVHPGTRYADTCISDVQVWVDSEVPYRGPLEQARQQRLDGWIQERVKTAQWFASQPTELPFAATAFTSTVVEGPPTASAQTQAKAATAALDSALRSGQPSRRARTTRLAGTPDGLWWLDDVQDLLVPGNVSWFQTEAGLAKNHKEGNKAEGWYSIQTRTHDRVVWQGEDRQQPAAVAWSEVSEGEERGPYSSHTDVLLRFGADGRATELVRRERSEDEMGEALTTTLTRFTWTGDKIHTLDQVSTREWIRASFDQPEDQRLQIEQTRYAPAP